MPSLPLSPTGRDREMSAQQRGTFAAPSSLTAMSSYAPVSGYPDHEMTPTSSTFDAHWRDSRWQSDVHFDPYREGSVTNLVVEDGEHFHPNYYAAAPDRALPVPPIAMQRRRRPNWSLIAGAAFLIIVAAIVVPIVLTKNKSHSSSSSSSSPSGPQETPHPKSTGATHGGNNSVVTTDTGDTFYYINNFGGDWVLDPAHPFAPGGRAQSWSPRVGNETWVWGQHIARGVNLGGWLVTEPFINAPLYEKYVNSSSIAIEDEWTLSLAMGSNLASEMENHYATFITEQDFAEIAGAGLNWVRIPIGFWAIETMGDEPFLARTSWNYFLKAISWARKYGLRIFLDLHALPGSQNGWNHSGKAGSVNIMNGVMGIANTQRAISYLRILIEFVSQPQYSDVVGMLGLVNEILWGTIGQTSIQSLYLEAYNALRVSTGTGDGNGPYIAIHDGFQGPAIWHGFLSGADRLVMDQHPYLAFTGDNSPLTEIAPKPCAWAPDTNISSQIFGVTVGGEFSTAINNCGLWLSGIGSTPTSPNCDIWDDWANYNQTTIDGLLQVTLASMDALQNFFFWTWKIQNSTVLGTSSCPLWHYQLGLARGWIPADPRQAIGHCASVLGSSTIFDGSYPPSATGSGPGTVDATQIASHPFPPATISPTFSGTQIRLLPTYTPTGAIKTLPGPTFTAAPTASVGDGWFNPGDTQLEFVPINGCSYPDPWNAVNATLPTTVCT